MSGDRRMNINMAVAPAVLNAEPAPLPSRSSVLGTPPGRGATCGPQHFYPPKAGYSLTRRSQQVMRLLCVYAMATNFYAYAYVVQKIALTAIVDQGYSSN
jgi:hypothetical protein